jgi:hypothetical protein
MPCGFPAGADLTGTLRQLRDEVLAEPQNIGGTHPGFLEALRSALRNCFRRTLVDSRSGLGPAAHLSIIGLADELVICVRAAKPDTPRLRLALASFLKHRRERYREQVSRVAFVFMPTAPQDRTTQDWISHHIFGSPGSTFFSFRAVALGLHDALARNSNLLINRRGDWLPAAGTAVMYDELIDLLIDRPRQIKEPGETSVISQLIEKIIEPATPCERDIAVAALKSCSNPMIADFALGRLLVRTSQLDRSRKSRIQKIAEEVARERHLTLHRERSGFLQISKPANLGGIFSPIERKRVLLVDDEITDLEFLLSTIRNQGKEYDIARNEAEAFYFLNRMIDNDDLYLLAVINSVVVKDLSELISMPELPRSFFSNAKGTGIRLCRFVRDELRVPAERMPIALTLKKRADEVEGIDRLGVYQFKRKASKYDDPLSRFVVNTLEVA